jgi:hypothetical protein
MLVSTNTIRNHAGEHNTDMNMIRKIRIHIILWPALTASERKLEDVQGWGWTTFIESKMSGECGFERGVVVRGWWWLEAERVRA